MNNEETKYYYYTGTEFICPVLVRSNPFFLVVFEFKGRPPLSALSLKQFDLLSPCNIQISCKPGIPELKELKDEEKIELNYILGRKLLALLLLKAYL